MLQLLVRAPLRAEYLVVICFEVYCIEIDRCGFFRGDTGVLAIPGPIADTNNQYIKNS